MIKINTKKIHDFKPKKIIFILILLFIVGGITYGIFSLLKKKKEANEDKLINVSYVKENMSDDDYLYLDSDNDGAYDWVENLWPELDPHNPDSDGDGVLDGKYIKRKREIMEKERSGNVEVKSTLTESEKLGRSIYTALVFMNSQTDGNIYEEDKDKISDNITKYISDLSIGDNFFLREDLNIVSDTKENSFAYRDKMENFFKKYPINTSEIELILKAIKDPKDYKLELMEASEKYDIYVSELSKMDVPGIIAGRHTELLNAASQLDGAIKNLESGNPDDIVSLSTIVQINKILKDIVDANVYIVEYFNLISQEDVFN